MPMFAELILAVEGDRSGIPARWVHACQIEAFDARPIVAVNVDGMQIVIVRDGERYFAAERACPHEGADLAQGRCIGAKLYCPRHLAWFDLQSGAVSPGWSFRPLDVYPVRRVGCEILLDMTRAGDTMKKKP